MLTLIKPSENRKHLDEILMRVLPYPYNELAVLDQGKRTVIFTSILTHFHSFEEYQEFVRNIFDQDYFISDEEYENNLKYIEVRSLLYQFCNYAFTWGRSDFMVKGSTCLWMALHRVFNADLSRAESLDMMRSEVVLNPKWLTLIPPDPFETFKTEEVKLEF